MLETIDMTKHNIVKSYITFLENGEVEKIINLFTPQGVVHSPLYGTKSARDFYTILSNDTSNSELKINGIFEDQEANRLALYFNYKWTLKNNKVVVFDVVDIIYFNDANKIIELNIIYDTKTSRLAIDSLQT